MKRQLLQSMFAIAASVLLAACASVSSTAAPSTSASRATAPADSSRPANPEERNRQFQKADALYLSGRLNEAAAAFADLSRKYPNDARVWLKYGNTLTKQQNYDEAAAAFQKAIALDPAQGGAALNLALVRLAQAQASLDVAVARLAPNSPEQAQAEGIQRQLKSLLR
jgi:tetratricopeptide (TPR) repeat protein